MKRRYEEIREYNDQEIKEILERQVIEELILLPLSVGLYLHNWRVAQNLCLKLAQHDHAHVRANAILGLAHIARTEGELDKRLVKPIVLKELKDNQEHRGTIIDAISDINLFLNWNLAKKHDL
ncbi:hypothetical protein B9G55_23970 [Saccharibacillus sp. O16]|nr:hypothetical protein B9G55_23970 [Saccharibacillus sp. O16]